MIPWYVRPLRSSRCVRRARLARARGDDHHNPVGVPVSLKNKDKILSDIVSGLRALEVDNKRIDLKNVNVDLLLDRVTFRQFSLVYALDAVSNDLYFDEEGDFSDADGARVSML